MATLAPITTKETFLTDLKQLHIIQHEVAWPLNAIKIDRFTSAEQIDIQRADYAVQVVFESADKSINTNQVFTPRCDKSTQVNEYHGLSP